MWVLVEELFFENDSKGVQLDVDFFLIISLFFFLFFLFYISYHKSASLYIMLNGEL